MTYYCNLCKLYAHASITLQPDKKFHFFNLLGKGNPTILYLRGLTQLSKMGFGF